MKKSKNFMIILLIVSLFLSGSYLYSSQSESNSNIARIIVEKANIRSKPTTNSSVIATLPIGTTLDLLESNNNWYKISFKDNEGNEKSGYIYNELVEIIKIPSQEETKKEEAIIKPKATQKKPKVILSDKTIDIEPYRGNYLPHIKVLMNDPNYVSWEKELNRTNSTIMSSKYFIFGGALLTVAGSAMLGGGISEVNESVLIGGIVIGGIGFLSSTYGFVSRIFAWDKHRILMDEARKKGYLNISINPYTQSFSVAWNLRF
ncbi:MAG: SH3 domain-containing protein [Atribacterota bacterium]